MGISWFSSSFKKKFAGVKSGMTEAEVRQALGEPTESVETTVPKGATWGMKPELVYKVLSGEPLRQWIYQTDGQFHYVWFGKTADDSNDPWRVSATLKVPSRL